MSDDDENLAAEYALGVLSEPERREVERRMAGDAAFATEVADWEARLAPIAGETSEVAPPRRVWRAIEDRLDVRSKTRSVRFWRNFGLGWMTLALASFAALIFVNVQPPTSRMMTAKLRQPDGNVAFVVAFEVKRNQVMVVPAAFSGAPQRAVELWIIPPGGQPRSLGLLHPSQAAMRDLPEAVRAEFMKPGAALAVSLEPPGGSPTGLPTGPVIAQGEIL